MYGRIFFIGYYNYLSDIVRECKLYFLDFLLVFDWIWKTWLQHNNQQCQRGFVFANGITSHICVASCLDEAHV